MKRIVIGLFPLSVAALIGCGHGAVVEAEPQFPRCREIVSVGDSSPPPVRWFGPGQPDEVIRHFKWCRAVGPMLLLAPPLGAVGSIDSLAIVSYNVNLGAGSPIELVDSLRAGAYTGGVPVKDFVLLLQETIREGDGVPERAPAGSGVGRAVFPASSTGERLDVLRIADSLRLSLFYAPAMRSGRGANPRGFPEDRGNGILATLPLTRLTVVELPLAGPRRIGQMATVRARTSGGRDWELQIANVHFAVGPVGPSALSAVRARQARAMAAAVDSSGAVVLGGDLNAFTLLGTAQSVRIFDRALPDGRPGSSEPTRGWQRLDYLFYRMARGYGVRPYVRLPHTFGSDHHPILGWVLAPRDSTRE